MSEIVHITFEKLTGLKGTIEGWFECQPETIDESIPLVFDRPKFGCLVFRQIKSDIRLFYPAGTTWGQKVNYVEHFKSGVNFLVKIDHGRGEGYSKDFSRSPN